MFLGITENAIPDFQADSRPNVRIRAIKALFISWEKNEQKYDCAVLVHDSALSLGLLRAEVEMSAGPQFTQLPSRQGHQEDGRDMNEICGRFL